jgi:hypothetical protein
MKGLYEGCWSSKSELIDLKRQVIRREGEALSASKMEPCSQDRALHTLPFKSLGSLRNVLVFEGKAHSFCPLK